MASMLVPAHVIVNNPRRFPQLSSIARGTALIPHMTALMMNQSLEDWLQSWPKVENPHYKQAEGRRELFEAFRGREKQVSSDARV
jgi:hypothetical protein